jgi:hypothetical protein
MRETDHGHRQQGTDLDNEQSHGDTGGDPHLQNGDHQGRTEDAERERARRCRDPHGRQGRPAGEREPAGHDHTRDQMQRQADEARPAPEGPRHQAVHPAAGRIPAAQFRPAQGEAHGHEGGDQEHEHGTRAQPSQCHRTYGQHGGGRSRDTQGQDHHTTERERTRELAVVPPGQHGCRASVARGRPFGLLRHGPMMRTLSAHVVAHCG